MAKKDNFIDLVAHPNGRACLPRRPVRRSLAEVDAPLDVVGEPLVTRQLTDATSYRPLSMRRILVYTIRIDQLAT